MNKKNYNINKKIMIRLHYVIKHVKLYEHAFKMLYEMNERIATVQGSEEAQCVCICVINIYQWSGIEADKGP